MYFVHSYRAVPEAANRDWVLATGSYGEEFVAAVNKGNVYASQFHPEKSGKSGLQLLRNFVTSDSVAEPSQLPLPSDGVASTCILPVIPFTCTVQCMQHCC